MACTAQWEVQAASRVLCYSQLMRSVIVMCCTSPRMHAGLETGLLVNLTSSAASMCDGIF